MLGNVVVPQLPSQGEIQELAESLWRQYRVEWEQSQPTFHIENVRFEHDPNWRENLFSIQAAHECNTLMWKAVKVTFTTAQVATMIVWYFI